MLTEATLWQAIPARLYGVTSLRTGTTEAWFAPAGEDDDQRQLMELAQTVAERYRQIERLRVMELAIDRSEASRLFLGVGAAEIETPHRLFASVKQIHSLLPHGWELGITISLPTDVDTLRITEIYRQAREEGLLVAYDEFQGNGGQVMHFESLVPDYLVLAPIMIKDLQPTRQPIRRLESLITACDELLIKPVLPRTDCAQTLAQCRELGYDLVLQSPRKRTNSVLLRQGAVASAAGVLV